MDRMKFAFYWDLMSSSIIIFDHLKEIREGRADAHPLVGHSQHNAGKKSIIIYSDDMIGFMDKIFIDF